jgi:uncharacterized membrane protein
MNLLSKEFKEAIVGTWPKVFVIIIVATGLTFLGNQLVDYLTGLDPQRRATALQNISVALGAIVGIGVAFAFVRLIAGLQIESKDYARNISRRAETQFAADFRLGPLRFGYQRRLKPRRESQGAPHETDDSIGPPELPPPLDTSTPEKLFQIARQRLLDDAVRLDGISTRNLTFGIIFSGIALLVLAWPLVSQVFIPEPATTDMFAWATRYYLPRFAVGLLLQFVGFFFLRLYVANENDLKHNKNELTNLEMKMMGLQLAQQFGDAASKKEIMKSLAQTERNFILKKNERSTSHEVLTEYNDLRGFMDKLVDKIPGTGKK